MSQSDYSRARQYLAAGVDVSDYRTWLKQIPSARLLESDAEPVNYFRNGRVLPNEESKTKTDIVIMPDGSRALLMTINLGGIETTVSLEISKPAKAQDETAKEDTNHTMSAAENDTVSDDMADMTDGD